MMKPMLLLLPMLYACAEPPKDDETPTEDPYTDPDRSGCTYDLTYDVGADGTDDWTQTNRWDDEGRAAYYLQEYLQEVRLRRIEYTYDAAGCMIGYEFEDVNEADGTNSLTTSVSSCDEHGQVTSAEYTIVRGEDEPVVLAYTYENTYDGDLLVEKRVSLSFDGSPAGTTPNRYTYAYDAAGLLIEELGYDEDTLFSSLSYTWLAEDKPLTSHYASDTVVRDEAWEYDAHDREIAETYEYDNEGERTAWYQTRTWDEAHYRVLEVVTDMDLDGTTDATWTYDCEGGWPWSCDYTADGGTDEDAEPHDGEIDHTAHFAYTCG